MPPSVLELLDQLGVMSTAQLRDGKPNHLEVTESLDPHIHLRDPKDGRLGMTLRECAEAHSAIIDIGNNAVEVVSLALLNERDEVVRAHMPEGSDLRVYYAPLVGKGGDPNLMGDIRAQKPSDRKAVCVKVFFANVSNAKTAIKDVDEIRKIIEQSTEGEGPATPITWHAECLRDKKGRLIPINDREYYCVTNQVEPALHFNPKAVHIIRHASDWRTIDWVKKVRSQGFDVHIEVSVQYLLHTEDSIFMADDASHAVLQCNCIYWPRPKDERSRRAYVAMILVGYDWVHIGSDFAMHLDDPSMETGVKITRAGMAVGGLTFRPVDVKALVIAFCYANGKPELINGLLSLNAARVYNIPMPVNTNRYIRRNATIPSHIFGTNENGEQVRARCFLGGQKSPWQREAA